MVSEAGSNRSNGLKRFAAPSLAIAACLLMMPTLGPDAALANNYRTTPCVAGGGTPCPTDDKNLVYYFDANLRNSMRTQVTWSRENNYEPVTNWSTQGTAYHQYSDLHFLEDPLPGNTVGRYTCSSLLSSGRCSHGHVRFDPDYIESASNFSRRWLDRTHMNEAPWY